MKSKKTIVRIIAVVMLSAMIAGVVISAIRDTLEKHF